jgi:hypothetical protein
MTTLNQARAALAIAQRANTRAQWQAAALALAAVLASAPALPAPAPAPAPARGAVVKFPGKRRARRANEGLERHTGKTPLRHVFRAALADGFTVRMSIGQWRGETIADSLAAAERLTLAIWRNNTAMRAMGGLSATIARPQEFNAAMAALAAPAIVELRIVKHGAGPRAGLDLECPAIIAAA